ncbi:MAG: DUF5615 family PIN-like protein [Candidatus Wallbacteria bacterium]|nr:DUF5615 family PIN-like protein [Candidatus Wallbacteria bacterium]
MRPVRLLFDIHVGRKLERPLRRDFPNTELSRLGKPHTPPCTATDPEILLWCEQNQTLFVSGDRKTMPRHHADHLQAGHHSWGVFVLRRQASLKGTIDDMLAVLGASDAEDWIDFIDYLPFRSSAPSQPA